MLPDFVPLVHEVLDANLVVFSSGLALPELHHLVELVLREHLTVVILLLFNLFLALFALFLDVVALNLIKIIFHFHLTQHFSLLCRKLLVLRLSHFLFFHAHDLTLIKLAHFERVNDEIAGAVLLFDFESSRLNLTQKLQEFAIAVLGVR